MKRLIGLLLLALVLCGCTAELPQETGTPTGTTVQTEPTEPAGTYVPNTDLETQTGGAVRTYLLEDPTAYAITVVDGEVLVFSGTETTTVTKLSGENLYPTARIQLGCMLTPEDASFQVSGKGITYFDTVAGALIFLDNDLNEVSRVQAPEGLVGTPVLSSNRLKLYYCTSEAVRVLDLETGLDKLLKKISFPEQTVTGTVQNDTVIRCTLGDSSNVEYTIFLSAETGELLREAQYGLHMTTGGGMYYVMSQEGILRNWLFGEGVDEDATQMLIPRDPFGDCWFLEETNDALTVSLEENATVLDHYDLRSGLRTGSVELPLVLSPWSVEEDAQTGRVYLMGCDPVYGQTVIYCWDPAMSAVTDDTLYTSRRYTLENPDTEGLEACADAAAQLGQQYGLEILVGLDAAAVQPWDYTLETEYQVPVIRRELETMERLLENFPDGFFETLGLDTKICLVRSISGNAESGSLTAANGVQFWQSDIAYVAVSAGDMLEQSLYHELFHVIDTRVLSNSIAYYNWSDMNPPGFSYDRDYAANQNRDGSEYLEDETRAFIDTYSMSYPKEDRARVFEYASTGGNESFFQSEIMQAKLKTLCTGIREAFNLRQYPNELIWEQYLEEPLTP